ncbi:MAG: LysM peptidoglycan-binding domain-containing protein [Opitutales bacterium]|nr:LysM peptidoglycan-binding domain-containing protein [Opitutales bacterium]
MKILRVFGLVLGIHVAAMVVLLLQPGCQSARTEPSPASTVSVAPMGDSAGEFAPPTAPPPGRYAPIRPETDDLSSDMGNDPFNADLSLLEPLNETTQSTYKVQRGDNLSKIARSNGVSLEALLGANGLSKTSTIYVGQELIIPASSGVSVTTTDLNAPVSSTYKVQRGDTLGGIARKYGIKVKDLKAMNGLTKDTIFVGQTLQVPEAGSISSAPVKTSAPSATVTSNGSTYKVQRGDTLGGIAHRYGVKVKDLKAVNGMTKDTIYVGQTLKLPTGASSANVSVTPSSKPKSAPTTAPVQKTTQQSSSPTPIRIEPGQPVQQNDSFSDLENLIPAQDEEIPLIPIDSADPVELEY